MSDQIHDDVPNAAADLMRRHGDGGRCEICGAARCPIYVEARTDYVAEPARGLDAAVERAKGPARLTVGPDVGAPSGGQAVQAFYALYDSMRQPDAV